MDVVGSEIGQKMRSAIKAKLTELGCYVDDELPDYVMVMVANKRTRSQMEDDLQLFLGDNTQLFVNWLHQVLKKLQEVTVAAPKLPEPEKSKEKEEGSNSKESKPKEKMSKEKPKKSDVKKAKKKDKEKEKSLRKKEQKKAHKRKKSKDKEMIRPSIPPLLMNMEKNTEPSITDVFAGQILKNHGILLESLTEDPKESKPTIEVPDAKKPIVPIIDPASMLVESTETSKTTEPKEAGTSVSAVAPREEQLKEINEIEAKIQGLKQKLAEQLDSMSEDEDFLNIRTEAEELMNDFAEDVFLEISEQTSAASTVDTPPLHPQPKSPTPPRPTPISKDPVEALPQIELQLPKRPIRERLGHRQVPKKPEAKQKEGRKITKSPESFTPDRELLPPRSSKKAAKSRIAAPEQKRKLSSEVPSEKPEPVPKRLTSRVSVLDNRRRSPCASVVRVRPRLRAPAPASSLLLRAVADAHKSLLNIPPKIHKELHTVQRALVHPTRRVDSQTIYVSVARDGRPDDDAHDAISLGEPESDDDKSSKITTSDADKEEYVSLPLIKKPNEYGPAIPTKKTFKEFNPQPVVKTTHNEYASTLTMKIHNSDYVPSRRFEGRMSSRKDDGVVIETINIHNPTVGKDKNTKFIVTMDGFNPNAFLTKKLQTEGILNDDEEVITDNPKELKEATTPEKPPKTASMEVPKEKDIQTRRLSDTSEKSKLSEKSKASEQSDGSVKNGDIEIAQSNVVKAGERREIVDDLNAKLESPPTKKRRSSPIVFDVDKKERDKDRIRERTESVGSDNHVTVTTTTGSDKYDALPPLTAVTPSDKKPVWCRAFPQCRYGAACAFQHPRCKFAASCTRRSCPYSHNLSAAPLSPAPVIASHVVPAANYKSISPAALPALCKYYPSCANPACHFYHPKPCRYGKVCGNKLECNFYHPDVASKWRYPV